jgi:hypothetical protein
MDDKPQSEAPVASQDQVSDTTADTALPVKQAVNQQVWQSTVIRGGRGKRPTPTREV